MKRRPLSEGLNTVTIFIGSLGLQQPGDYRQSGSHRLMASHASWRPVEIDDHWLVASGMNKPRGLVTRNAVASMEGKWGLAIVAAFSWSRLVQVQDSLLDNIIIFFIS
jgi:hypothetical protein